MPANGKIRIAIDAMGGDHAPGSIVEGAVLAQRDVGRKVEVLLLGDSFVIDSELGKLGAGDAPIKVIHCPEVIGMAEEAAESVRRKPNSSIVEGLNIQKRKLSKSKNIIAYDEIPLVKFVWAIA